MVIGTLNLQVDFLDVSFDGKEIGLDAASVEDGEPSALAQLLTTVMGIGTLFGLPSRKAVDSGIVEKQDIQVLLELFHQVLVDFLRDEISLLLLGDLLGDNKLLFVRSIYLDFLDDAEESLVVSSGNCAVQGCATSDDLGIERPAALDTPAAQRGLVRLRTGLLLRGEWELDFNIL